MTWYNTQGEVVDAPQLPVANSDDRVPKLEAERAGLIAYARLKLDAGDYHAVADAAMDLREIDAKLSVLRG